MFPAMTSAFGGAEDESSARAILRALEVFYLGACRRFTAQQEAGKVKGQRVLVLVESDEAHSGISEALGELG